jgi:hypothetical protein
MEMATRGLIPQQIDGGKLPGRTLQAISKILCGNGSIVYTIPTAIVENIEEASDMLAMERVVRPFSRASAGWTS